MRTLTLLLALCVAPFTAALAQEQQAPDGTLIESAEVSGLPMSRLSPGLRQAIDRLVGTPLSKDQLADLAARIEAEQPDVVTAVRTVSRPDAKARVVFLVARIDDDTNLRANINGRYLVEDVKISGVPDSRVSQALRDDLQAMVGQTFDSDRADALAARLATELRGRRVGRRVTRGSQRGQVHVVFEAEERAWIAFGGPRSKLGYHEDLGWTGTLDLGAGGRNTQGGISLVFRDRDNSVETARGYVVHLENRKLGTPHVGASLQFSWLRQSWEQATLDALAAEPAAAAAYHARRTIEPKVTFAFDPHVHASAGISSSELEPLAGGPNTRMANAFVASIGFARSWRADSGSHDFDATYGLRDGETFDSDFTYRRHLLSSRYQFQHRGNVFIANFFAGHMSGTGPIFERFALGDSVTLRGWNKYDLSPTGAANAHSETFEYRVRHVAFFLDAGSVWAPDTDATLRLSAGLGYHGRNGFATFAFPLNADKVSATFLMGLRF